jgi:fructose-specific component phosphotransferase system IIB-like protein
MVLTIADSICQAKTRLLRLLIGLIAAAKLKRLETIMNAV